MNIKPLADARGLSSLHLQKKKQLVVSLFLIQQKKNL